MAYRRRNGYGRRPFKRRYRPGYNRTSGFYNRNKRRRSGFGYGRGIESKFFDFELSDSNLIAGGQFVTKTPAVPHPNSNTLNDIAQGTGESQRIGRKCTLTKIHCRLIFEFLQVSGVTLLDARDCHETVRVMLIWDTQCNGSGGSTTDVLDTNEYDSYRNLANVKRFRILMDKLVTFNTSIAVSGDGITTLTERYDRDYQVRFSKKLWIPIEFAGTTGGLTEIATNNLQLLIWTKHGDRMGLADSKCRIRYIDM